MHFHKASGRRLNIWIPITLIIVHQHIGATYVPAKCAVLAAKERLWANKYMNPNSVWWQVQGTKERLWTVKNACRTCWQDQEYGWMEKGSSWVDRY
jgi:hypothetical protein